MNRIIQYITISLAALGVAAVAGVAAYAAKGGFQTQSARQEEPYRALPGSPGVPGALPVIGEPRGPVGVVTSVYADFLSLHTLNGGSLRVNIYDQTIVRLASGSRIGKLDDIKSGDKVRIVGRPNSDGSFNAELIRVLPDGADLFAPPLYLPETPEPAQQRPDLMTPSRP